MYGNSIWEDIRWQYRYGSPLIRLILVNVAVFIGINLLLLIGFLASSGIGETAVSWLSFRADALFFTRPWGILSYQFLHVGLLHLVFNMLALYWFGQIVQDLLGRTRVWPVYILGGISGAFLFTLGYHLLALTNPGHVSPEVLGASAGVMAIVLASATTSPDYEFNLLLFGPVKIKWIALAYVVLDILMIRDGNAGGHFAHLGGALFGWLYVRMLRQGTELARPYFALTNLLSAPFERDRGRKTAPRQLEKTYAGAGANRQGQASGTRQPTRQERLDEILDKIGKSGYDSLNKEEKDFLFRISKED